MQKKAAIGAILVLIALVMVGISFVMPWYYIEGKGSSTEDNLTIRMEFYLDHAKIIVETPGVSNGGSEELFYDDANETDVNFINVFKLTSNLIFIGTIGCVIGLIGALLVSINKISNKLGAIFVIFAITLAFLAPIYLMVALPQAFVDDNMNPQGDVDPTFFGSEKKEVLNTTLESNWGGMAGWFLPIIAAVMCITALILVAKSKPIPQAFSIDGTIAPGMAPADQIPSFSIEPETPVAIPMAQPVMETKPKGEEFHCPQCSKIFIVALEKRPLHIKCPYCGLEGIVE